MTDRTPVGSVHALPPEPPPGAVVEIIGGTWAGDRYRRDNRHWKGMWFKVGQWESHTWALVLALAKGDGVRVIEDGTTPPDDDGGDDG